MTAVRYRLSMRLYVVFSLLMAGAATASGLLLLHLARPFITDLAPKQAAQATAILFSGAAGAGALAAVAGLIVGIRIASRIRGLVERAQAVAPPFLEPGPLPARDELSALESAVGRLTLSMDRFVRDSDILARLPEGVLFLGPTASLLMFNETAETLLRLRLASYRGVPLFASEGTFPLAKGNEPLAQVVEQAQYGDRSVHTGEVPTVTAAGEELLIEVTAQRRDWAQTGTALVLVIRDASEKRRIREEIRRADQLAFLGGLTARIAHEIRTPQATIRGLLELLQADLPSADPRREYVDRTLQALDRQDRLVEHLLTLTHPDPETWQAVGVGELLRSVLDILPLDPRLIVEADDPTLSMWGDPVRLGEVFSNLIKNALEATPMDGVIEVRARRVGHDRVMVRVRNTGVGIPPKVQERIFQPFFTTKTRGTGLGLAIASQIVAAHHGQIRVESDGTSETTFVVELPVAAPASAAPVPRAAAPRVDAW